MIPAALRTATFRGWTASLVPVGLWAVHLLALASLAQPTCDRPELGWIAHALTAVLALACLPFLVMAARLAREGALEEVDETEAPGDLHMLGWLAVAVAGANLLLIVAEWLIVLGVHPCL